MINSLNQQQNQGLKYALNQGKNEGQNQGQNQGKNENCNRDLKRKLKPKQSPKLTRTIAQEIIQKALNEAGISMPDSALHQGELRGRHCGNIWLEQGFGLRSYASGRKVYFVQARMAGKVRTITIAPAAFVTETEARSVARLILARACLGNDVAIERKKQRLAPLFDDFMAEYWGYIAPRWKPSTRYTNDKYRAAYLDGAFAGKFIDQIDEADVLSWFTQVSDRSGPGGANQVMAILQAAFNKAEAWEYYPEGSNPCRAIKRNRGRKCERFLSGDELLRLGSVLEEMRTGGNVYRSLCASGILLLVLTGCRRSEIFSAQWGDVSGLRLKLRDSKVGPRTVWLGEAARRIIDELPRVKGSIWLFPNGSREGFIKNPRDTWVEARDRAGLAGVRLHDLRHSFASHAAMNSETLPMIARLLGHANIQSTARYAHYDDSHILTASQQIADKIEAMMGGGN